MKIGDVPQKYARFPDFFCVSAKKISNKRGVKKNLQAFFAIILTTFLGRGIMKAENMFRRNS